MYVTSSLFATVLFATVLNFCTSETIFIKTNSSDHQCPAEPCLTLQEFVSHHHRVESNTVLEFLPGNHIYHQKVSNVVNVTLTGVSDQQNSVIHCVSEFSIFAKYVQNIKISKLNFSDCRAPIIRAGPRSITLILSSLVNATILDTHVHDSKGAGMFAGNAFDLTLNTFDHFLVTNNPHCGKFCLHIPIDALLFLIERVGALK